MSQHHAKNLQIRLKAELDSGCEDKAIAGGLERLLAGPLAADFPQVRRMLDGYHRWRPQQRALGLRKALAELEKVARAAPAKPSFARALPLQASDGLEKLPVAARGGVKKLHAVGLRTVRDLLHHYPHRHEDRRTLKGIAGVQDGQKATLIGTIEGVVRLAPRPKMTIVNASLRTREGAVVRLSWFNQPWVEKSIRASGEFVVSGTVKSFRSQRTLNVEHFERVAAGGMSLSSGRILGVYGSKEGTGQDFLRRAMHEALSAFAGEDHLTPRLRADAGLIDLKSALWGMHFPSNEAELAAAMHRFKFEECLFLELRVMLQEEHALGGNAFQIAEGDIAEFEAALPFSFTNAQRRVLNEIAADMCENKQMARMVQGDVGSGKTAVAACAMHLASKNGFQAALMAPTEILARQHFNNLQALLGRLGLNVGLLIGAMTPKEKSNVRAHLASGALQVVVGTQALIQDEVSFHRLGLAVIDEEHRFGVMQRRKLLASRPDLLVMTATPIPRSLALTQYGDLEMSVIDELPPGRTLISTRVMNGGDREAAYDFAMSEIDAGRQVYAVTALVEESETMEVLAATALYDELVSLLPRARVALLHGKMSANEKDEVMQAFRRHQFDLLVSTTVIEVGVDVSNASVMIIENAERFGLSQLHQLRGRVGRGALESHCILIAGDDTEKGRRRLGIVAGSNNGFEIAEADLRLRGPGELRGTKQSGVPELQLIDLDDTEIIEHARAVARNILKHDPQLQHPRLQLLREELIARSERVTVRDIV